MSKTEEPTVREMVDVMSNVAVEVDVHWILGPDGQGLVTWGDVSAYMEVRFQYMDDDVVKTITDKLRHEYHIKVLQMEVKEVPRYDIFLQHNRRLLTVWCVGDLNRERSLGLRSMLGTMILAHQVWSVTQAETAIRQKQRTRQTFTWSWRCSLSTINKKGFNRNHSDRGEYHCEQGSCSQCEVGR